MSGSTSQAFGGAFYVVSNALSFNVKNSLLNGSVSGSGGFIYSSLTSSSQPPVLIITNSQILNSTASVSNGGFGLVAGDASMQVTLTLVNTSASMCSTKQNGGFF